MTLNDILEKEKGEGKSQIRWNLERNLTAEGVLRIAESMHLSGYKDLYVVLRQYKYLAGYPTDSPTDKGEYVDIRLFSKEPELTHQGRHPDIWTNRDIFICSGGSWAADLKPFFYQNRSLFVRSDDNRRSEREKQAAQEPFGKKIRTMEIPIAEMPDKFDTNKGLMFPGLYKIEIYKFESFSG